jgi:hypothetical protein
LGIIAQEKSDPDAAENWYQKSLKICEQLGDQIGAAISYNQMGIVAGQRGDYEASGEWLIRAAATFHQANNPHMTMHAVYNFYKNIQDAQLEIATNLKAAWNQAGLPDWDQMAAAIEEQMAKADKKE